MKLKDLVILLATYAISHGDDVWVEFEADGKTWQVGGAKIETGYIHTDPATDWQTYVPVSPSKITLTP